MSDMEVQMDLSGFERVLREEPGRCEAFLDWMAASIEQEIQESFGTSPPGRTYKRGRRTHVASQPEYPPNVDIGTLARSIHSERSATLERTISDGVEYGIYLEDGTTTIAPRPFMGPAFDEAGQRYERDAANHLDLEA